MEISCSDGWRCIPWKKERLGSSWEEREREESDGRCEREGRRVGADGAKARQAES